MGFLKYQATRAKRTATVGLANDLGSFSGLEVSVYDGFDGDFKTFQDVSKQETDAEPSKKQNKGFQQRAKAFLKRKKKDKQAIAPLAQQNQGGKHASSSKSSENLSVYTNGVLTSSEPFKVTLDHVADLVLDLETAVVVGAKRPLRALKMLLLLSGSNSNNTTKSARETRIDMVRADEGKLVPVLLSFLNRCMVQSKEHTLALLLLGNLSIPHENKKAIALDCKGAEILATLLCEDPSSHLLALVLVNLTYDSATSDSSVLESTTTAIEVTAAKSTNDEKAEEIKVISSNLSNAQSNAMTLNQELLAANDQTALVESLAFALRVSSLTPKEYEKRRETIEDCNFVSDEYLSPATRLSILMAKDQQLRCTPKESQRTHHRRRVLPATASPEQILKQLKSNEQELHRWGSIDGTIVGVDVKPDGGVSNSKDVPLHPPPMVEPTKQMYPETAKWCLSALRNLGKPCHGDATAAHVLIKSGVFSLVVQCITTLGSNTTMNTLLNSGFHTRVARMGAEQLKGPLSTNIGISSALVAIPKRQESIDTNFLSASYCSQNVPRPFSDTGAVVQGGDESKPERESKRPISSLGPFANSPDTWESNSMQDAALSIVLNLAASCNSREYMYEPHVVKVLTMIAEYPTLLGKSMRNNLNEKDFETMTFQALKARMALSYLIGSQGHFGQAKLRSSASTIQANRIDSSLVMSASNVELLVELLANTMNHRGKEGNGGGNYLSGTFDLKCVILSLRCLLTHTSNQEKVARLLGSKLNTLLINALARYALEPSTSPMDSESSGHVVFALYLLSNHCFEGLPFLPNMYACRKQQYQKEKDHGLAANILMSYLRLSKIPPEGRHAAQQLLLRLKYLSFETDAAATAITSLSRTISVVRSADLKINYILLAKIKRVQIAKRKHGSKPNPAIFRGRVLRCQRPFHWGENHHRKTRIEWRNPSTVSTFANALTAVQQLSYGSLKARHSNLIDDIAIANKIARSANHEAPEGCHSFLWAWEISKMDGDECTSSDMDSLCEIESFATFGTFSLPRMVCCSSDSIESGFSEI